MRIYDVSIGDQTVGSATVERQGLFYRIKCRCSLDSNTRYHLRVWGTNGEEDVGLLIPEGRKFGVTSSVAIKKLGENLQFALTPRYPEKEGVFVPLKDNEPFAYLSRLNEAAFVRRGNQPGLEFASMESSKPTGQ